MSHEQDPPISPEVEEEIASQQEGVDEELVSSAPQDPAPMPAEDAQFREKYLRELAEKENMRKRLLREQQEAIRLAGEKSAIELLAPIDQFEKALEFARSMSDEVKNWALGFEMICAQIQEWLAGQGIHSFKSEGEMFTPLMHEAIERIVDNDRPAGLILREFTKGYRGRTRVLRPARVAVCVHEAKSQEDPQATIDTEFDTSPDNLETSTAQSQTHHGE